jgi:hypothetical protein
VIGGTGAASCGTFLAIPGWRKYGDRDMADHRHTDSETEPAATQQLDMDPNRSPGTMWGWVAAIFAVIVIMALAIGFKSSDNVAGNDRSATATTTGSAPAASAPFSTQAPK